MKLEHKAVEEMKNNPCTFRNEYYNKYWERTLSTCDLTNSGVDNAHHSGRSSPCNPIKCPIWKTYVMQLEAYKGD